MFIFKNSYLLHRVFKIQKRLGNHPFSVGAKPQKATAKETSKILKKNKKNKK